MKRVLPFLLTYIVSLMSVSCVDEISDSSLLMQEITFTASFDASSETKTILVNGSTRSCSGDMSYEHLSCSIPYTPS